MSNAVKGKMRSSNIELLRIISMLVIVAHHYVVNSGLMNIIKQHPLEYDSIALLMFGWGGKTAINCFLLITGYFMCQQDTTLKKYLKFLLQVLFWNILIGLVFIFTGYESLNFKLIINAVFPFNNVGNSGSFTTSYLFFYLCIPFLNLMLKVMDRKTHRWFLIGGIIMFSVLPSIGFKTVFNSIIWFSIVYMIGAYLKLYNPLAFSVRFYAFSTIAMLFLSLGSILMLLKIGSIFGKFAPYFLVNEENKVLALLLSLACFMFFVNLNMRNYKFINLISSACFGVLLIHANSAAMRTWLWKDIVDCQGHYGTPWMLAYAITSVLAIYIVCTILEIIRIKYFENALLNNVHHLLRKRF